VFLVLWLPVIYGTFIRKDGNLGNIIQFFQQSHNTTGFTKALQALGLQWGSRPEWILGPRGNTVIGAQLTDAHWWLPLSLVLGVIATVIAARRRSAATLWLAGFVGIGFVAAVVAVSNTVDLLFPYLIRWTWVIGTALGILVLRGLWLAVSPERRAAALRWVVPAAAVVLVVISATETVSALTAGTPYSGSQAAERTISREVLAHLPAGHGTVLIDNRYGAYATPGIVLQLEKHGIASAVVPSQVIMYGYDRDVSHGPYRAALMVVTGRSVFTVKPKGRRIALYERPQSKAGRQATRVLIREARKLPPSKNRTELLAALESQLHLPGKAVAVYAVPIKRVLRLNAKEKNPRLVRPLR
jgi:hypothetical protein